MTRDEKPPLFEGEGLIRVEILGMTPGLMMHNAASMGVTGIKTGIRKSGQVKTCKHDTPIDDPCDTCLESMTYRDEDGNLAVPAVNLSRMLVESATGRKTETEEGQKVFLTRHVASTVRVNPDFIPLLDGGKPVRKYEVDSRYVRIQGRGRVARHRPFVPSWSLKFWIIYDRESYEGEMAPTLQNLMRVAARRVGLCEYRPWTKGPFGRFEIVKWEG